MHDALWFSLAINPPRQGAVLCIPAPIQPLLGRLAAWAEYNQQEGLREGGVVGGEAGPCAEPFQSL